MPAISDTVADAVDGSGGGRQMSSPSPQLSSTLTSIRDAVSHLTRLDDFNVVKLSQGFFSQVFKVTHHSTKKVMVLKMNKQAGNRGNALKEIELLNKLNHENIVAFMGTVVHEGALHPLLEYINGGTLEKLILQYYKNVDSCVTDDNKAPPTTTPSQPIANGKTTTPTNGCCSPLTGLWPSPPPLADPSQTFVKLAVDVASGMEYLHSQHYLHRDLTSKNVFIRKSPPTPAPAGEPSHIPVLTAVIGDFGFAAVEPTADQKLATVGSPYWLAPECLKGQWYNHKCDIFSYGVICCELNWRIPADPDYLPRNDNFVIEFDKLWQPSDTLLARIARLACQKNPCFRPEFTEILEMFDSELTNNNYVYERDKCCHYNNGVNGSAVEIINGCGDIFDQHLIRRRNSQIEKQKLLNSIR